MPTDQEVKAAAKAIELRSDDMDGLPFDVSVIYALAALEAAEAVRNAPKPRPTIAELEAILAADTDDVPITIHPDGSISPAGIQS